MNYSKTSVVPRQSAWRGLHEITVYSRFSVVPRHLEWNLGSGNVNLRRKEIALRSLEHYTLILTSCLLVTPYTACMQLVPSKICTLEEYIIRQLSTGVFYAFLHNSVCILRNKTKQRAFAQ